MKKKKIGVLLALCMVMGMLPVTAFAQENTVDTWDGTADTSWYDENETEFEISTAEQLAGLAVLVNGTKDNEYNDYTRFVGKTICLTSDLDLSGHEWISIGRGGSGTPQIFCGTFDGQNHVITGLYSHEDYDGSDDGIVREHNAIRNGLFGGVYQGTIKNLGVTNADIFVSENDRSSLGMGIIADHIDSSDIINCYSSGCITGGSGMDKYIGGLIGFGVGKFTVQECYSQATITGNYTNSEGIYTNGMDYWDSLGGLIGAYYNNYNGTLKINDCWFDGKIVVNSMQAPAGGIVGYSEGAEISNCMVATTDIGDDGLGNTFWISYELMNSVTNCVYPNNEKYWTNPGNYPNGPEGEEISAGMAADNFKDDAVLSKLQENAADGVEWVAGINHPTFSWDERNIPADYTAVDAAIEKANALNKDNYKDFTAVEAAIAAVERDKNITEQTAVDEYATAIENAIAALEYKGANYTAVDEGIAKANALNKDEYKDFSAVEAAINAVVRGKNITEQATVDKYAADIENAINALEYKGADYSKVDEAIKKANALNKDEYKDFSVVEAAINAVVRGKNITEQTIVDKYAADIENSINALEYKGADYSKVDEAIKKANALNKDDYKDFSAVEAAVNAVVRGKNITEQTEVDAMAKAINDAIASIEKKLTDKSISLETGDNSNMWLWLAVMVIAGGGVIVTTVHSKKKKGHAE